MGHIGKSFDAYLEEQLRDPEFRKGWEDDYWIIDFVGLRTESGLTQAELAERIGTRQSAISRVESGNANPSLGFLRRAVEAMGGRLVVKIERPAQAMAVEDEEPAAGEQEDAKPRAA